MIERRHELSKGNKKTFSAWLVMASLSCIVLGGEGYAATSPDRPPMDAVRRDANVQPCNLVLADAGNTKSKAAEHSGAVGCDASAKPFVGEPTETPKEMDARFMMVSAYHLEPYSQDYLENVLSDLARHHASGIVYSTLGSTSAVLKAKGVPLDEGGLNRSIFQRAHDYGADIWLQMRVYDNKMSIGGVEPRNYTSEELLNAPGGKEAFAEGVKQEFLTYNQYFKTNCVVIMFEEAGIYHSAAGGGTFWSSQDRHIQRQSRDLDETFASRFAGLFQVAKQTIRTINPTCKVGVHLGHSAFNDQPVLEEWIGRLARAQVAPDFIFYDFYLKSQPDFQTYAARLEDRAHFITQTLRLPAMHLAQLHTMNNFQHGLGATPSRSELDAIVDLDRRLGFKGIGFYTKNAVPTVRFDNDPMGPNTVGQATVYESSKDRWDYGLLKVYETGGVDFRTLFDLVIRQQASSSVEVFAKNVASGAWDLIGVVPASQGAGPANPALTLFRAIDARRYLSDLKLLTLRFKASSETLGKEAVWVVPSEPSRNFRSTESVRAELTSSENPRGARGFATMALDGSGETMTLCMH